MNFLDNRVYPNLCPETLWGIMNNVEKDVFGFIIPKPFPKNK